MENHRKILLSITRNGFNHPIEEEDGYHSYQNIKYIQFNYGGSSRW